MFACAKRMNRFIVQNELSVVVYGLPEVPLHKLYESELKVQYLAPRAPLAGTPRLQGVVVAKRDEYAPTLLRFLHTVSVAPPVATASVRRNFIAIVKQIHHLDTS